MGHAVAAGPDDTIAVAGGQMSETDGQQIWVGKLDASGQTLWTQTSTRGAADGNFAAAVSVAPDGAVVAVGSIRAPGDPSEIWVRVYEADGRERWTATFSSLELANDVGRGVALGPDGNPRALGTFLDVGSNETQARLAAYDPQGGVSWAHAFGGVEQPDFEGYAVAAAPDDSVVVAGCQFDSTAKDSADIVVAKLVRER